MFENQLRRVALLSLALFLFAQRVVAQQTPAVASSPNGSPSPTPPVFSPQTLSELKRLQQAALESDHAYRQVAQAKGNNLSTGQKIGLAVAIGVLVVLFVVAVKAARR